MAKNIKYQHDLNHVTLEKIDWHVTGWSFEKGPPPPCSGRGLCGMSMVVDCPRGATAVGQGFIGSLVGSGSWDYE
uniref:Uncharacterized protein n=1 Tax=Romanomermis culicivorax TaxID=13658 RepID=A0A915J380_ROMCU